MASLWVAALLVAVGAINAYSRSCSYCPYHVTAAATLLHQGKVYANSSKSGYLLRDNRPQCSVIVKDVEPIKCD
jgi:hypothetical protein